MKNKTIIILLFLFSGALFLSAARPQAGAKKSPPKPRVSQEPRKEKSAARPKYFLRVSYAMGLAGSDQTQTWSETLYGENIEFALASKFANSSNIHVGLGRNFGKSMAVGLGAILHASDIDAALAVKVPSPWEFNAPREVSASYAASLKATVFYLNFIYELPFRKFKLGLFAGPAYFNSSTEVVSAVAIEDVFPNDSVAISLATEKVKKSGIGFNAGLELDYFFSRSLGAFLEVRYLSGSSTFASGSQTIPGIQVKVGGPSVGAGLVFRF